MSPFQSAVRWSTTGWKRGMSRAWFIGLVRLRCAGQNERDISVAAFHRQHAESCVLWQHTERLKIGPVAFLDFKPD